jgi:hypothetical protein
MTTPEPERFGMNAVPLGSVLELVLASTNRGRPERVSKLLSSGLSAATTRKAVFALRQCRAAAMADERIPIQSRVRGASSYRASKAAALSIPMRG